MAETSSFPEMLEIEDNKMTMTITDKSFIGFEDYQTDIVAAYQ